MYCAECSNEFAGKLGKKIIACPSCGSDEIFAEWKFGKGDILVSDAPGKQIAIRPLAVRGFELRWIGHVNTYHNDFEGVLKTLFHDSIVGKDEVVKLHEAGTAITNAEARVVEIARILTKKFNQMKKEQLNVKINTEI